MGTSVRNMGSLRPENTQIKLFGRLKNDNSTENATDSEQTADTDPIQ